METHLSRVGVFCDVSKRCSEFAWQLDGNCWNDPWATGSFIAWTLQSSSLLQLLCAGASFFYFSPPSSSILSCSCSFLFFDNLISQICDCHGEMSRSFQPFQPLLPSSYPNGATHPTPPPPSYPCSLCPLTVFGLLLSAETQFPASLWPQVNPPPLPMPPPCLSASTLLSPPPPSPFCFCFHLLLRLLWHYNCISDSAVLSGTVTEVCYKMSKIQNDRFSTRALPKENPHNSSLPQTK